MAKITDKNIDELNTWNMKELRKLRIMCKNRLGAPKTNSKSETNSKHILSGYDTGLIEELLVKIHRAEKKLANS
jgi:hypothetical protein